MKRINILYISTTGNINKFGAERRLIDIVQSLDKEKFFPLVWVPKPGAFNDALNELGIKTVVFDFLFRIRKTNPIKLIRLWRFFIGLVKNENIDLVHFNMQYFISNFWPVVFWLRLPAVVHSRSCGWIDIVEKFFMSRCSRIIFVSNAARDAFFRKRRSDSLMCVRNERCEVIYDGINVDEFQLRREGELRNEFSIGPDEKIIALVGAIDPFKGVDLFIKSAHLICGNRSDVKFLIVGEEYYCKHSRVEYAKSMKTLVCKLGLGEKIIFTGYRDDVARILRDVDMLVQPSQREALGTSMIEAMACGKAVVGVSVEGIPEVIGSDEAGILVKERTPEMLAKAILKFLDNPDLIRKKGREGKERVRNHFDIRKNIHKIEKVYDSILNSGTVGRLAGDKEVFSGKKERFISF